MYSTCVVGDVHGHVEYTHAVWVSKRCATAHSLPHATLLSSHVTLHRHTYRALPSHAARLSTAAGTRLSPSPPSMQCVHTQKNSQHRPTSICSSREGRILSFWHRATYSRRATRQATTSSPSGPDSAAAVAAVAVAPVVCVPLLGEVPAG